MKTITKEEYLEAKRIVQEYESTFLKPIAPERTHRIAVISFNLDDFNYWRVENGLFGNNGKNFKIGNIHYHCISSPEHTKSYSFDEMIETPNAKLNSLYGEIIRTIKPTLKSQNK